MAYHPRNTEESFWKKVDKSGDCWTWTGNAHCKGGHGQLSYQGRHVMAHRLSWELTNGEIPDGLCVLHKCDNPTCVNPEHLFIGTQLDNRRDCVAKQRQASGEKNGFSKLTWEEVHQIRKSYRRYNRPHANDKKHLATRFGVSVSAIHNVIHNTLWKEAQ